MDFNKLMEFIEGDEEMGYFKLDNSYCHISVITIDEKKILNLHFYGRYEDDYEINKEMLDDYLVDYRLLYDEELSCEKITVDVRTTCIVGGYKHNDDELDFGSTIMGEYVELPNSDAFFSLNREKGKKKLKITLFIDTEQEAILDTFCNRHNVHCSKLYKGGWIDPDAPPTFVRCNFLPMKA